MVHLDKTPTCRKKASYFGAPTGNMSLPSQLAEETRLRGADARINSLILDKVHDNARIGSSNLISLVNTNSHANTHIMSQQSFPLWTPCKLLE